MELFGLCRVDSSCRACDYLRWHRRRHDAIPADSGAAIWRARRASARQTRLRSIHRAAGQGGEFASHPFGNLTRDRKLAVAFEMLDREPGLRIIDARELELAVAEIAERALDRQHLARRLPRRTLRRRDRGLGMCLWRRRRRHGGGVAEVAQ